MQTNRHSILFFLMLLTVILIWFDTHPYYGIIGDSRFYTVQALEALSPGRYANDLYFKYGSQDQFTLFTEIYAPFIKILGLSKGNITLLLISDAAWLTGLYYFIRAILHDRFITLIAMVSVVTLPFDIETIQIGETFLTPRLIAEGLTLFAFSALLNNKTVLAYVLLSCSMLLHPLMTLPGLAICFLYQASLKPIYWIILIIGTTFLICLAASHIEPFARLLMTFDPEWFSIIAIRNSYCFVEQSSFLSWLKIILVLTLLCIEYTVATLPEKKIICILAFVGLSGIIFTYIGGDVFHDVLILDTQQIRAFWPVSILAYALIIPAIIRIKPLGNHFFFSSKFMLMSTIFFLILSRIFILVWLFVPALAIFSLFAIILETSTGKQMETFINATILCIFIIFCFFSIYAAYFSFKAFYIDATSRHQILFELLFYVPLILLLACFFSQAKNDRSFSNLQLFGICILAPLAVLVAINWKQRHQWDTYVETTTSPPSQLEAMLPMNSTLYWEGDVTVPWFLLHRDSYFSCEQGTGALFSRNTAISFQQRYDKLRPLNTIDFNSDPTCRSQDIQGDIDLSKSDIEKTCTTSPRLDFLVLLNKIPNTLFRVWVAPIPYEYLSTKNGERSMIKTSQFFIYDCSNL